MGTLGGTRAVALSMAPKAVTTPIAMAVSAEIGGIPALTAALAIIGEIVAAIIGQRMLGRMRIDDWRARGLAAGIGGNGVAAARVATLDGLAAAFAAHGIAPNGLATAILSFHLFPSSGPVNLSGSNSAFVASKGECQR